MLLRRSKKKKQKKALLEAQKAAAAMQASGGYNTLPAMYPRPTSTISVPANMHEGYDNESGSDELEMIESMSLTGEYHSLQTQQQPLPQSTVPAITTTIEQPTPSSHYTAAMQYAPQLFPSSVPTHHYAGLTSPLPQPPVLQPTTSANRMAPPNVEHSLRRGISQPVISNIPPAPPPVMATPIEHSPVREQHQTIPITPVTSTITNTLPRPSSHKKLQIPKIDPAKMELIKTVVSLGLGRGLDATSKSPWTNKSSFQVRRVHQSIVETNEGGVASCYEHELTSVADMSEMFQASLNPPETPVTLHVEADSMRCINSSRQIVGKRVLTRTVGFQTDIEEKYTDGDHHRNGKDSHLVPRDPTEVVYNTQNSMLSFEERVYQWLLHKIAHKCTRIGQRLDLRSDDSYADQLMKLIHSNKTLFRVEDEIKAGCREIIQALRVTHYVTMIHLGAAEYRIISDGEYHRQLAQGGAFGLDTLAEAAMSGGFGKQSKKDAIKMSTKMSHVRKIGIIGEGDKVEKSSTNEVVLTVQVQPITRLIRVPAVKASFRDAIESYMEGTPASEGGPFIIKCTGRDIYLTVNKYNNYEVEGTEIPTEASLFYFHSTDDGGNPFDFHIAYYGEDVGPGEEPDKGSNDIGRYLEACPNSKGHCPGPLLMKHSVKVRNTRFTLRSRLSKKYSKSHLNEWIAGEDAFYIAISTRRFKHDSYLAVKTSAKTDLLGKHFFITEGFSSIHKHNGDNIFMLFQLLPKESLAEKNGEGRETPGKLPVQPSELTTREQPQLVT